MGQGSGPVICGGRLQGCVLRKSVCVGGGIQEACSEYTTTVLEPCWVLGAACLLCRGQLCGCQPGHWWQEEP